MYVCSEWQSNCTSVIVAHVKLVSALVMWLAFSCVVVTACSMFLVYKVFTLSGVPTHIYDVCICEPNKLPFADF